VRSTSSTPSAAFLPVLVKPNLRAWVSPTFAFLVNVYPPTEKSPSPGTTAACTGTAVPSATRAPAATAPAVRRAPAPNPNLMETVPRRRAPLGRDRSPSPDTDLRGPRELPRSRSRIGNEDRVQQQPAPGRVRMFRASLLRAASSSSAG
jgi:hypothetical protein